MPIENRDLAAGTRLAVRHKGQVHTCAVVKGKNGEIRYRLENGQEFNSPSSAGREITNGVAVNGWRFWSIEGDLKERKAKSEPKAAKPAAKKAPAKKASKKAAKKAAKKKSARAASKGDAYGCGACGKTFPTQKKAVAHAMTHTSA